MIKVNFFIGNNQLTGFEISGHSGYDEYGRDIVCAAVSSASLMCCNTITEVIGDNATAHEEDGKLYFRVDCPSQSTVMVLEGLKLHLTELSNQYPKNINITYGGVQHA